MEVGQRARCMQHSRFRVVVNPSGAATVKPFYVARSIFIINSDGYMLLSLMELFKCEPFAVSQPYEKVARNTYNN